MTTKQENVSAVSAFKVWIFPSLVSIISLLIWNDVNEIKADVKALMVQSSVDKTRIDNLEREIFSQLDSRLDKLEKKLNGSLGTKQLIN